MDMAKADWTSMSAGVRMDEQIILPRVNNQGYVSYENRPGPPPFMGNGGLAVMGDMRSNALESSYQNEQGYGDYSRV